MNTRLSPHFTLAEMIKTSTGLPNNPGAQQIAELGRLATTLLEPVRALLGVRMHVNSGYRSPAVNDAVQGSRTSQHMAGQACDFVPVGMSVMGAFERLVANHHRLPFRQLIVYPDRGFIHISIARNAADEKHEALVNIGGNYQPYPLPDAPPPPAAQAKSSGSAWWKWGLGIAGAFGLGALIWRAAR